MCFPLRLRAEGTCSHILMVRPRFGVGSSPSLPAVGAALSFTSCISRCGELPPFQPVRSNPCGCLLTFATLKLASGAPHRSEWAQRPPGAFRFSAVTGRQIPFSAPGSCPGANSAGAICPGLFSGTLWSLATSFPTGVRDRVGRATADLQGFGASLCFLGSYAVFTP